MKAFSPTSKTERETKSYSLGHHTTYDPSFPHSSTGVFLSYWSNENFLFKVSHCDCGRGWLFGSKNYEKKKNFA